MSPLILQILLVSILGVTGYAIDEPELAGRDLRPRQGFCPDGYIPCGNGCILYGATCCAPFEGYPYYRGCGPAAPICGGLGSNGEPLCCYEGIPCGGEGGVDSGSFTVTETVDRSSTIPSATADPTSTVTPSATASPTTTAIPTSTATPTTSSAVPETSSPLIPSSQGTTHMPPSNTVTSASGAPSAPVYTGGAHTLDSGSVAGILALGAAAMLPMLEA
jgi:hypothetical protein